MKICSSLQTEALTEEATNWSNWFGTRSTDYSAASTVWRQLYCSFRIEIERNFWKRPIHIFYRRPQIIVNRSLSTPHDKPYKRSDITTVCSFEVFVVFGPELNRYDGRRITCLHEDKIHEQATSSTIAIVERMYMNELVVSQCRHLDWMKCQCFIWVQPAYKFVDQFLNATCFRGNVIGYVYLYIQRNQLNVINKIEIWFRIGNKSLIVNKG